jgi:hypothetical protein
LLSPFPEPKNFNFFLCGLSLKFEMGKGSVDKNTARHIANSKPLQITLGEDLPERAGIWNDIHEGEMQVIMRKDLPEGAEVRNDI